MGNTIDKGGVSLESFFFINNQIKVGISNNLEAGAGFTLWPNEDEDTTISVYPLINVKYKYVDKRHFKATAGITSMQLPPLFSAPSNGAFNRKPLFHILYTSANWEYKYGTFAFSIAQPYFNLYPLKNAASITTNDKGFDYLFSASYSIKVFPFAHFVSENIFLSGAWNTLGKTNTINRETYLVPLIGGRYYGDYYSFAGGFSNVLIPKAIFWFYLGGSYYFK